MKKHLSVGAVILSIVIVSMIKHESRGNNEEYISSLAKSRGTASRSGNILSEEEAQKYRQDSRALARLWLNRKSDNITQPVIDILEDPSTDLPIQEYAVEVLGKLEDPVAEQPLKELKEKQEKSLKLYRDYLNKIQNHQPATKPNIPGIIDNFVLEMALARIRARNMEGKAKIETIVKPMNLSWEEVVRLSQKVNVSYRAYIYGSEGDRIIEQIIDVLYNLQKQGHDVDNLIKALTLSPEQRVKVEAGKLSQKQEIEYIINHLIQQKSVTPDLERLSYHLAGLGGSVVEPILAQFKAVKGSKSQIKAGHSLLYRTARFASVDPKNEAKLSTILKP